MMTTDRTHRLAVVDSVLVAMAALGLFILHLQGRGAFNLLLVLATPVVYVIASKLLTRGDLPSTAARSYLLCFLAGVTGLIIHGHEVLNALQQQLVASDESAPASSAEFLRLISLLVPYMLGPLALGIAIYTVASVFESSNSTAHFFGSAIEKVGRWLAESQAPEEVRVYVMEMVQHFSHLQAGCQSLGDQAIATQLNLTGMQSAVQQCQGSLEQLTGSAHRLQPGIQELANDVAAISASLDQLKTAVSEIHTVVDDLSRVVSHKILEL